MAIVRMFYLWTCSTALRFLALVFIAFFLYVFYVWENANTFTTVTKQIFRNAEAKSKQINFAFVKSSIWFKEAYAGTSVPPDIVPVKNNPVKDGELINVIITFSNVKRYLELQEKFRTCVSSMLGKTRSPIVFYIIGDHESKETAEQILQGVSENLHRIIHLDVTNLAERFSQIIRKMLTYFTIPGHYYNDPLFFLSLVIHRVMPLHLHKVIMLDSDLKFQSDIKQLYALFGEFKEENIIGIAKELQPVYRHAFSDYRKDHPGTRVGDPPPDGLTGFNSGVLLLDLDRMRKSQLYNSLIDSDAVFNLTQKYSFKGFLGDQDFFTLLSFEFENLFYILPCTWNRQLCEWFRNHGYSDVFDEYSTCKGHTNIYHGNCNTSFPV